MCCLVSLKWCRCAVVIGAAAFINNGCRFEGSMARLQHMTVATGGCDTLCESMGEYTPGYNNF